MVAVLVRDQDAADIGGLQSEARKAPLGVAQVQPAID
jgi:hypothetical protein